MWILTGYRVYITYLLEVGFPDSVHDVSMLHERIKSSESTAVGRRTTLDSIVSRLALT